MTRLSLKPMHKYLSILLIYITVFALLNTSKITALTKLEYYRELFSTQYGFKLTREDPASSYAHEESLDTFTLMLASEFKSVPPINTRNNVIIICDVPYRAIHPYEFRCDTKSVESNDLDLISGLAKSVEINNNIFYVIPEGVLIEPSQRERLAYIFAAIHRSDSAVDPQFKQSVEGDGKNVEGDLVVYPSVLKLLLGLFLLSLLLWTFSLGSTLDLKRAFTHKVREIVVRFYEATHYMVVPFIVLLLMYIPLVMILNIRDSQLHNPFYVASYFTDTLNPKIFIDALENNYYYRLLFFFYTLLLINILVLILLPAIISTWSFVGRKVFSVKFKNSIYKYAVPCLLLFEIVLVFLRVHEKNAFLPVFVLTTLLVLLIGIYKQEGRVNYTQTGKIVNIVVITTLLAGYYIFSIGVDRESIFRGTINLIKSTESIVTLPLKVAVSDDIRFNEYLVSKSYPIFANNYLIYAPTYPEIRNKPLSEFVESGDYYIQGANIEDKIKSLNEDPSIIELLGTTSPTSFFRFTNSSYSDLSKDIYLTIELNCGEPRLITATHYYGEGEELSTKQSDLLYFPGCGNEEEPQSYTVTINYPITTDAYIYTKLNSVEDYELRALRTNNSTNTPEIQYISTAGLHTILTTHVTNNFAQPITNYYVGSEPSYTFVMNYDSKGKIDIAQPLNELLSQKQFESSFILWSTAKYEIFRSTLD